MPRWLIRYWFVVVLGCLVVAGCGRPRPLALLPSPDGRMTLVPSVNSSHADPATYGCVVFTIQDAHGKVLAREQTHAADRMRWTLSWRDNDTVVLDSSDIGTYTWRRSRDGKWMQAAS